MVSAINARSFLFSNHSSLQSFAQLHDTSLLSIFTSINMRSIFYILALALAFFLATVQSASVESLAGESKSFVSVVTEIIAVRFRHFASLFSRRIVVEKSVAPCKSQLSDFDQRSSLTDFVFLVTSIELICAMALVFETESELFTHLHHAMVLAARSTTMVQGFCFFLCSNM